MMKEIEVAIRSIVKEEIKKMFTAEEIIEAEIMTNSKDLDGQLRSCIQEMRDMGKTWKEINRKAGFCNQNGTFSGFMLGKNKANKNRLERAQKALSAFRQDAQRHSGLLSGVI